MGWIRIRNWIRNSEVLYLVRIRNRSFRFHKIANMPTEQCKNVMYCNKNNNINNNSYHIGTDTFHLIPVARGRYIHVYLFRFG